MITMVIIFTVSFYVGYKLAVRNHVKSSTERMSQLAHMRALENAKPDLSEAFKPGFLDTFK
jgi:hypothetical protein